MKNNIIYIILLASCLFGTKGINAQQIPLSNVYNLNMYSINPAYAGFDGCSQVAISQRNQWLGIEGAPVTRYLTFHHALNSQHGIGLRVFSDQLHIIKRLSLKGDYAYHWDINNDHNLSVGVSLGAMQNHIDFNSGQTENANDPILGTSNTDWVFDSELGLLYRFKELAVGVSVPQIFTTDAQYELANSTNYLFLFEKHYLVHSSYDWQINQDWKVQPLVMYRFLPQVDNQFDFMGTVFWKEKVSLGLGYRTGANPLLNLGYTHKDFTLGYSYGLAGSTLVSGNQGSHEIAFMYHFCTDNDRDRDGIINRKDKCPDVFGYQEFDGCPDRDDDGITDSEDKCPDVAGVAHFDGCPDTDNDSIPDSKDKCPDVAGIAAFEGCPDTDMDSIPDYADSCSTEFGPMANNGCPWPDTDGDGVLDKDDDCINTAGPASNKGCPVITEEEQEVVDYAFENLEFETNKDIIKHKSELSLDELAKLLTSKPDWGLNISGHTDDVGSAEANMKLSQKRAEAVKQFLMSKGVDASRLKVFYYGEEKPIASNDTKEGRQKNRRVVMEIVFK